MCCHEKDMDIYDPIEGVVETGDYTVVQEEPEIAFPPPHCVEPTQEMIDECADRDDEIAAEGEPAAPGAAEGEPV